uniref:Integrase n=1 Tax=Mycobacterium phage Farewell TaxID=3158893 RepID=A0AAU8GM54_9CAUD
MASVHRQVNKSGVTYRVLWRENGRQRSVSLLTEEAANRVKRNIEQHGGDEAIRMLEIEEAGHRAHTLVEWLNEHCDHLTGVNEGTIHRYRRYIANDIEPFFGEMPITAVTEQTISRWVQWLEQRPGRKINGVVQPVQGKTIQNKHGFLSGALNAAVAHKPPLIAVNPCLGRSLPETVGEEMVFLEPAEFELIRDCIKQAHFRNLAVWLVCTGMRFSEATALTPADINVRDRTARVRKAWKYTSARSLMKIGPPKTKRSNRSVSIPQVALDVLDLSQPEWLFTNTVGTPIRAQEFFNQAWKPAREAAQALGLTKTPRVHDLRHTAASWWIQAGVPLPVIQAQLGHESITTTVNRYGHIDRRSAAVAASVIDNLLQGPKLAEVSTLSAIERGPE